MHSASAAHHTPSTHSTPPPHALICLSDFQADSATDAIRHAARAAGFPWWARLLISILSRSSEALHAEPSYLARLVQISVQIAPLQGTARGLWSKGEDGVRDVVDERGIRPECRAAVLAGRMGAYRV